MRYEISAPEATKKTINVTFDVADVNAAIDKVVLAQRASFVIPGFRKGKVPAAVIEKRLGEEINMKATQKTMDDFLAQTLKDEKLFPLSAIDLEKSDGLFKRGSGFSCTLVFDVLPEIAFPTVEGLEVEQRKVNVTDEMVKEYIDQMHDEMAEIVPLKLARTPQDGDQVNATYSGFDDNNAPIEGVNGTFDMIVGKGQVIPDFEALIKKILPGSEQEGPVTFPEDYHAKDLAGRTITMKVKVNDVKERKAIPMDDDFARKAGAENLEKLHETVQNHIQSQQAQSARGDAMAKLLDMVMANVADFDIPQGLVDSRLRRAEAEFRNAAQHSDKPLDEKDLAEWKEAAIPEIKKELKPQVFLMALARSKDMDVSEQEVNMHIYMNAMRAGQDIQKMAELYQRSGMINDLRDRLLAEKGMKFIYDAAKVTETEPTEPKAD